VIRVIIRVIPLKRDKGEGEFSKREIFLLKINMFQRFKYQKNCAVSTVLMVFKTLTNIDFHYEDSHFFENENSPSPFYNGITLNNCGVLKK